MTANPSPTLLELLDPRLKLVLLPLLIAATFSAGSPLRLGLLSLLALWLFHAQRDIPQLWRQVVRPLRYLLLVTLLIHLVFSSGHTLLGRTWLSLDGLQLGLLTCWRLLVAVMFAVLLTRTSPSEELAAALGDLLAPLKRFGLKVDALSEFLFLTLSFIPVLQRQAKQLLQRDQPEHFPLSYVERLRQVLARIEPMIFGFADQAEVMATQLARGERIVDPPVLGALRPVPGGLPMCVGGILFLLLVFAL